MIMTAMARTRASTNKIHCPAFAWSGAKLNPRKATLLFAGADVVGAEGSVDAKAGKEAVKVNPCSDALTIRALAALISLPCASL